MSDPVQRPKVPAKSEWLGVGIILFAFLFINLLVATRTPTVYIDEPVFADPAANLYFGSGFTSTMWSQDHHEMWSSQPPLYSGLLYVFFKCFGFGLLQARMMNSLYAAASGLLIWAGLRRTGIVQSPRYRWLSLALILSGSVSVLTFRMIRYDIISFFVCALVFFACSLPANRMRYLWIVLSSLLFPFTGVPMLPYVFLLIMFHLAVYRFRNFSLLFSVGIGFTLGAGLLLLFYYHFGVLRHFLDFVFDVTGAVHRESPSWKSIVFGKELGDASLLTSFFGNPVYFEPMDKLFDYSAFLLFVLFALFARINWSATNDSDRRLIRYILMTTLIVPPVLQLAAHYWSDYRWMTYIPLAIAVPRLLELSQATGRSPRLLRVAFAVIGVSLFLGVPLRSLVAVPDWSARSITPLEHVTARIVQPNDVVICHYKTYFAVRPHAQLVYGFGMSAKGDFRLITDLPTNQVSLLCLFPANLNAVLPVVGGKWKKLSLDDIPEAAAFKQTRYGVDFYRRDTN